MQIDLAEERIANDFLLLFRVEREELDIALWLLLAEICMSTGSAHMGNF